MARDDDDARQSSGEDVPEDSYEEDDEDDACDGEEVEEEYDDAREAPVEEAETSREGFKDSQVLSEADIMERQRRHVDKVVNILGISRDHASILLRTFKWNVSQATDEWFSDEDKVRRTLGLFLPAAATTAMATTAAGESSATAADNVLCGICFDDFPVAATLATTCGHRYCEACWRQFAEAAISEGPGSLSLRCPTPKCGAAVGDSMILKLVGENSPSGVQFRRFLFRSYVEGSVNVKWCPAPNCAFAVATDGARGMGAGGRGEGGGSVSANVGCDCGHRFCWNCQQEPHRPVECDVVRKWMAKNSAESENMNWILVNSKPCPKCRRPIEKSHGCMHMTCSAPCKYEFCWLCLGDWKTHGESTGGFYACNRYEEAKKKGELNEEEERKERARASLERYLHYYERWATNERSRRKAEESLIDAVERQGEQLRCLLGIPAAQMNFLEDAWRQVIECRRVLKWTYAYGFYLSPGLAQKKAFFEHLQGQADNALDRLHKMVEKDVEKLLPSKFRPIYDNSDAAFDFGGPDMNKFIEFRSKLSELTDLTRRFFDNLAQALEDGLAEVSEKVPVEPGKGKGERRKDSRKRRREASRTVHFADSDGRRRRVSGEQEEEEEEDGDRSSLGAIDSGDDDEESGDEGDTAETSGVSSRARGSGAASSAGPVGSDVAAGSGAGAGGMAGGGDAEYWTCPHCTYGNPVSPTGPNLVCEMCRLPRNRPPN